MKRRYDLQVIDGDTEYSINTYYPHKVLSFLAFLEVDEVKLNKNNIQVDMDLVKECMDNG